MAERRTNATVSPSGIRDFRQCPHRYYLTRVAPEPPPRSETPALIVGSTVHQWLEAYSVHLTDSGYSRDAGVGKDLLDPLLENVDSECASDIIAICKRVMERDLFPESAYDNPTFRVERKVALTKSGKLVDWDSPKAMWRGVIDAMWKADNMVVIRDWKTNRRPKSRTEIVADAQLAQYAWAALQLPEFSDCSAVEAWLYYVRYGAEVGVQWPRVATVQTYDDIVRWSKRVNKERDWPPRIGPACSSCLVSDSCDEFSNAMTLYKPLRVASPDDAREAAKMYSAMATARGQLQKRLKEWVDENGPIQIDDASTLNIWVDERHEFTDVAGLVKHLDEVLGVDRDALWSSLKMTKTDLISLLKGTGYRSKQAKEKAAELLLQFGIVRHSARMEVRKTNDTTT